MNLSSAHKERSSIRGLTCRMFPLLRQSLSKIMIHQYPEVPTAHHFRCQKRIDPFHSVPRSHLFDLFRFLSQNKEIFMIVDSQGRKIRKHELDPTGNTEIFCQPGFTIDQLINRIERANPVVRPGLERVLIALGSNDLTNCDLKSTSEKFLDNLDYLLRLLKGVAPNAEILFLDVLPRQDVPHYLEHSIILDHWAKQQSPKPWIVRTKTLKEKDFSRHDGVHLTPIGIAKVMARVKDALKIPRFKRNHRHLLGNSIDPLSLQHLVEEIVPRVLARRGY